MWPYSDLRVHAEVTTDYERGYRDGLVRAAELLERYVTEAPDLPNAEAARHLRSCASGLRLGTIARDITGAGE